MEVRRGAAMKKISIRLTEQHYEMLEALVAAGEYASVSEAIRDAIRRLLAEKMEVLERSQRLGSFT
ncbi:MAG: CopG family transcriptional regulator [Archaeoglobales archaeon]|nr:MAG: CopG family transcriptional regulator [Archaeoglobales archaeon]